MSVVTGDSSDPATPAVSGSCPGGDGVVGTGRRGVVGISHDFQGVYGHSDLNAGVVGESPGMHGMFGITHGAQSAGVYGTNDAPGNTGAGVLGENPAGDGVAGIGHRGVVGTSNDFQGVYGHSNSNVGVVGESETFDGVWGATRNPAASAVSGHNPGGNAGYFDGNVVVTGDLQLSGADYAENFPAAHDQASIAPGSVVVLDDGGRMTLSRTAYDNRVAGIVSGAGSLRPGVILNSGQGPDNTVPLALMGKVVCRVDGRTEPIRAGDLLTTSSLPGRAMRVTDRARAVGAIVGKALAACDDIGEIPVLVTLQ
jgi:hypothetical protein